MQPAEFTVRPFIKLSLSLLLPLLCRARIFFSAREFHQYDSSNNELYGLRLMDRVEVLGIVNPNPTGQFHEERDKVKKYKYVYFHWKLIA